MNYEIILNTGKVICCDADMLEETDDMFILSTKKQVGEEIEKKTKAVYMKHKVKSCEAKPVYPEAITTG